MLPLGTNLSPDARTEWDRAANDLTPRAEDLSDPAATFARTTFLKQLSPMHNQAIYGRRGSGKTHLLRAVKAALDDGFPTNRTFAIYINGATLRHDVGPVPEDPQAIALSLYVGLMTRIATDIYEQVTRTLSAPWWQTLPLFSRTGRAARARSLSYSLKQVLATGEVRILPSGSANLEARNVDERVREATGTASVAINASAAGLPDLRNVGLKLDAKASRKHRRTLTDSVTVKPKADIVVPYLEIARRFGDLLGLLTAPGGEAAKLVLLFDEWSEIDGDVRVQPYLAEMIKRTLRAMQNACLKVACIPGRTRLATPITVESPFPLGFEAGEDIVVDVDLDLPGLVGIDRSQLIRFFFAILHRHMGARLPWVAAMSLSEFGSFTMSEVVADERVFTELCQASGCVPRDFLHLFRTASRRMSDAHAERVTLEHLRAAARSFHDSKIDRIGGVDSPMADVLQRIFATVSVPNRSYWFLLSDIAAADPVVTQLHTSKLIHRTAVPYFDADSGRSYIYYLMDYGQMLKLTERSIAAAVYPAIADGASARPFFEADDGALETLVADMLLSLQLAAGGGELNVDPRRLLVDDGLLRTPPKPSTPPAPDRKATRRRTGTGGVPQAPC